MEWSNVRGVTLERALSDSGSVDRSRFWHEVCDQVGITVKKTRPHRPQTNGKIERFQRTLADGWAYAAATPASRNAETPSVEAASAPNSGG